MPHTGSWRPLATAANYLVCIAPIVYMAFQAQPASPMKVQPDSGMGRDRWGNIVLSKTKGGVNLQVSPQNNENILSSQSDAVEVLHSHPELP
ncbi:hypothetical protein DSO57_1027193 [Entomophthora muscae]|uniref:Uncharacterized protein n=1 Tax=Entomophthora muscae TaxID=34485 RepID=A0ACC2TDA7_9FUNG|nr:hypothetical protein DSO57_1027193 [Entomophthora muscae]